MKQLHNRVNRDELKSQLSSSGIERTTVSFYKYAQIGNVSFFRDHFYLLLDDCQVLGRVYVANEGVNAQISVPSEGLGKLRNRLNEIIFLQGCRLNCAIEESKLSFYKLQVKKRTKIVADGIEDEQFDVTDNAAHINASEFNKLSNQDDTIIIDMRNHYESEVGYFDNAIRPDVETFRESLPIVEGVLNENADKNVIMYCTGGIRCEKATAYFKHRGFENLYQLDGGIIEYARQAKNAGLSNRFVGKNFVFDDRLGERISEEIVAQCHQCGNPCDDHANCANDQCHILFIQCKSCAQKYQECCSPKCADFNEKPQEEKDQLKGQIEFNGTRFGKGRYKASRANEQLEMQ